MGYQFLAYVGFSFSTRHTPDISELKGVTDAQQVHVILAAEMRRALAEFADWCSAGATGTAPGETSSD